MDRLIEGVRKFQREGFPALKPVYEKLVREGQKPHTVMIGCSDSRVAFETLTGCGPGELFIIRNAGNIVPRYGFALGAVTASVEFAVTQLPIRDIVVCGHSHCGAIAGLMRPELIKDMPSVKYWVSFCQQARQRVIARTENLSPEEQIRAAVAENVLLGLENLMSFPFVRERVERGEIKLHGWLYDIEAGRVFQHDLGAGGWEAI